MKVSAWHARFLETTLDLSIHSPVVLDDAAVLWTNEPLHVAAHELDEEKTKLPRHHVEHGVRHDCEMGVKVENRFHLVPAGVVAGVRHSNDWGGGGSKRCIRTTAHVPGLCLRPQT